MRTIAGILKHGTDKAVLLVHADGKERWWPVSQMANISKADAFTALVHEWLAESKGIMADESAAAVLAHQQRLDAFATSPAPSAEYRNGAYILRPYQINAVEAGVRFMRSDADHNGLMVLPVGSGKSLVIANIALRLGAPVLVFQPSKEILEQNLGKLRAYGYDASVYSASMDRKEIGHITFATIGSVRSRSELFRGFKYIIIDEAHLVNAKNEDGMYTRFLNGLDGVRVLGLTASPFRLTTDGFGGSILKFLTRTRPRIFKEVVCYVQNGDLFRAGYLAKLKYTQVGGFDRSRIRLNSTGADFDDTSVRSYYAGSGFREKVVETVRDAMQRRRNALIFTRFVEESEYLVRNLRRTASVTADTPRGERESIIADFRSGEISVIANCGVLVCGFDYPELECVILACPTMSLARYYQAVGRCVRPHPEKDHAEVIDLCGNYDLFGKVEDLRLVDGGNGKWFIQSNGKALTNVYYGERDGDRRDTGKLNRQPQFGRRQYSRQMTMGSIL